MNTATTLSNLTTDHIEQLHSFIDNATVGIHLVDNTGTVLYANNAELQMLGYSAEEYIGRNIKEFHVDEPVISTILTRLLNNEQLINHEAKLRCKDGSVKIVLISSNVYRQQDRFIHTRCFTRDISRLKKVEQLLRFLNTATEELVSTYYSEIVLEKVLRIVVPEYADWFSINILKEDGTIQVLKIGGQHLVNMNGQNSIVRSIPPN